MRSTVGIAQHGTKFGCVFLPVHAQTHAAGRAQCSTTHITGILALVQKKEA